MSKKKATKKKKQKKPPSMAVDRICFMGHTIGTSPSRIPCMTERELKILHDKIDRTPKGMAYDVGGLLAGSTKRAYER